MLDICNSFALEHDLIFNSKTSLAIKYGEGVFDNEAVYLGENRIIWVDSVRHLGNFINSDLTDATDCRMKCSSFIGSVNKLRAQFGHLQPNIKGKLFNSYCCSFYGSPLWDFNSSSFKKVTTTWNIGVRTILDLPTKTHAAFFKC